LQIWIARLFGAFKYVINIKIYIIFSIRYSFSAAAGPQTLGYLYQAQYALYALLTADGEESALILARVYTQV